LPALLLFLFRSPPKRVCRRRFFGFFGCGVRVLADDADVEDDARVRLMASEVADIVGS
jgi:hypothetical protein